MGGGNGGNKEESGAAWWPAGGMMVLWAFAEYTNERRDVVIVKRFVCSAVISLLVPSAAFAGKAEAATTLRLGHVVADNSSLDKGLDYFAKLVSDKSGGELKIQVFPNSSLGDNTAMMEQLQFGSLDMMAPSVAAPPGFTPSRAVCDLPYLFHAAAHPQKLPASPPGPT